MEQRLEKMLDTIDAKKECFCKQAIEMHEDERLRELAGYYIDGFNLVNQEFNGSKGLYFSKEGFTADIPKYEGAGIGLKVKHTPPTIVHALLKKVN